MTLCRWLTGDDLAAWRDIRSEALRREPEAFLTTLAEFGARPDGDVRAQLAQGKVVGAFEGTALVGCMAYVQKSRASTAHRAELSAVYLREDARGTGVANALLTAIENRAALEGVVQLELWVWDGNLRATHFYERHGFVRMGRMPRAVMRDGVANDDLFYVRALDQ